MLERQQCPVWMVDAREHSFLDANEAACKLFDLPRAELLRSTFLDVLERSERERYVKNVPEALENWGNGGTWVCLTGSGSRFTLKLRFHVTMHGSRVAFFCFPVEVNGEPTLTGHTDASVRIAFKANCASAGH